MHAPLITNVESIFIVLLPPLLFLASDVEIRRRRDFTGMLSHSTRTALHSYVTFTIYLIMMHIAKVGGHGISEPIVHDAPVA